MSFFGSPFFTSYPSQQRHPQRYYYDKDDDDEEDAGYSAHPFFSRQQQQQQPRYYRHQQHPQLTMKELERRRQLEAERQRQVELERQRRYELQRQYELKLRQEREQELQRQRLALEQQQLRRKVLLLRFTHAAKVIQRAVRVFLEQRRLPRIQAATVIQRAFRVHLTEKRTAAAALIQAVFRRHQERKTTAEILAKLKVLAETRAKLDGLRETHEAGVLARPVFDSPAAKLPNKEFLVYEDALLKLMLVLDGINSGGFDLVREARKRVVSRAQGLLKVIDQHKQTPPEVVMEPTVPATAPEEQQEDAHAHEQQQEQPDSAKIEEDGDDEQISESSSLTEVDHPQESPEPLDVEDEELVSTDSNWVVLPQATEQ